MKLYLLRHATAVDIAPTDAARALTPRGEEEARRLGLALTKLGAKPTHVFSSPLLRARQTATIAARSLPFAGAITQLDELTNSTPTGMLLHALKTHRDLREALLVGHMPSLVGHVCELAPTAKVTGFTPAGGACIELPVLNIGSGKLLWLKQYSELKQLA